MRGEAALPDPVHPDPSRPEQAGVPSARASIRAMVPIPAPAGPVQLQIGLDPAILHARIPDFAVVVALRGRPELREAAVIVGDAEQGRGTVWAASAAARAQGVVAGMALRQAEALYPRAVVLPVDRAGLRAAAGEVLAVLGACTPIVAPSWVVARSDGRADGRSPARGTRAGGMRGDTLHARGKDAGDVAARPARRRGAALPGANGHCGRWPVVSGPGWMCGAASGCSGRPARWRTPPGRSLAPAATRRS